MYYKKTNLRFSCTGCGVCCHGRKDSYIELKRKEAENIRKFLKLSPGWFRRRYLIELSADSMGVRIEDDGECVFLNSERKCRIYSVRPVQCKTYPFWPEVVQTRKAWMAESGRCEGIGRGQEIELQVIERRIKQCT